MELHYKGVNLDTILSPNDNLNRTKLVCTIGPSCDSVEMLAELMNVGLTVARLNFSHGDHKSHLQIVKNIKEAKKKTGSHAAILLDTKGPEIRTGFLEEKKPIQIKKGSIMEILTDYEIEGDATKFACSYKGLPNSVTVGDIILAADGSLSMKVTEVKEESVLVEMQSDGVLGERKNMNLPGNKVDLPTITKKDYDDISAFAKHIDFVAASFVQNATDIDDVRAALGKDGEKVRVIAKIENQEGLKNFDSILEAADGIMVARGDLGMEIPIEKVFLAQKMMIRKCNLAGKPVITATQMLESMVKNPRPTRAETADVANAVLDGSDCVMLSGETAGGEYPIEAASMMISVCKEAENVINHRKLYLAMVNSSHVDPIGVNAMEAVCSNLVKSSLELDAQMILVVAENGYSVGLIAKYRPPCPVLVITPNQSLARQLYGLCYGTYVHTIKKSKDVEKTMVIGTDKARELGFIQADDIIVTLHRYDKSSSNRHLMEIFKVPEKKGSSLIPQG